MNTRDLRTASVAHVRGSGLIEVELESRRDRDNQLIYALLPAGGTFVCQPDVSLETVESLVGQEVVYFGYGRSELGLYTLAADVFVADRKDFPMVSLRVIRLHDVRIVAEPGPQIIPAAPVQPVVRPPWRNRDQA